MKNNTLRLINLKDEGKSEKERKIHILFIVTCHLFHIVLLQ